MVGIDHLVDEHAHEVLVAVGVRLRRTADELELLAVLEAVLKARYEYVLEDVRLEALRVHKRRRRSGQGRLRRGVIGRGGICVCRHRRRRRRRVVLEDLDKLEEGLSLPATRVRLGHAVLEEQAQKLVLVQRLGLEGEQQLEEQLDVRRLSVM